MRLANTHRNISFLISFMLAVACADNKKPSPVQSPPSDTGVRPMEPADSGTNIDSGTQMQPMDSGIVLDTGVVVHPDAAMMLPPDAGAPPPMGSHIWAKVLGGADDEYIGAMTKDSQGNIYLTGSFGVDISFGGASLSSSGLRNIFLVCLSPDGTHRWSKVIGGAGINVGQDIAIDDDGNIYLSGFFDGTTDFGGGPLTSAGRFDNFFASYTPTGDYRWAHRFGDWSLDDSCYISIAPDGSLILGGSFVGTVDFGGGPLTALGYRGVFIARFTSQGVHLSSHSFGDEGAQYLNSIETDADGNLYVGGFFSGTLDFGMHVLTSTETTNSYIASFTPMMESRWVREIGNDQYNGGDRIKLDNDANVYFYGSFRNSLDFGGGTITSTSGNDAFVASYTSAGDYRWVKHFGGMANDDVSDLGFDAQNNVYFAGAFNYSINFDGVTTPTDGSFDAFFARFNTEGEQTWVKYYQGPGQNTLSTVWVDPDGTSVLAGVYQESIVLGGTTYTSTTSYDIFLHSLSP